MSESAQGGIGFFGLLTIVLITLKLTELISISWVWVLAPIWAPILLGLMTFGVAFVAAVVLAMFRK